MTTLTPLGQWIDEKQYAAGKMSDAELGRRVGLSRQQVGAIKKGQSGTKADVIRTIAKAVEGNEEEALQLWTFGEKQPEIPAELITITETTRRRFLKTTSNNIADKRGRRRGALHASPAASCVCHKTGRERRTPASDPGGIRAFPA